MSNIVTLQRSCFPVTHQITIIILIRRVYIYVNQSAGHNIYKSLNVFIQGTLLMLLFLISPHLRPGTNMVILLIFTGHLLDEALSQACHLHCGVLSFTSSRNTYFRADSRFAPSQWETALLCNDVSHWLGARLASALYLCSWFMIKH